MKGFIECTGFKKGAEGPNLINVAHITSVYRSYVLATENTPATEPRTYISVDSIGHIGVEETYSEVLGKIADAKEGD